jgi:hypothetical protein
MRLNSKDHSAHVGSWIKTSTPGLSSDQLIELFEFTLDRLWKRSSISMSEVTLVAVIDRALFNSSDRFKLLELLKIDIGGIDWKAFKATVAQLNPHEVTRAFTFFITEIISIIGNITGELISGPLLQELTSVKLDSNSSSKKASKKSKKGDNI